MEPDPFLAEGVDFERANAARMYDYYLGGTHNFAVDREQADAVIASWPGARRSARSNRTFLGNAVRWCLAHGVDQFLDLGSGVPTANNVHEVAHAVDPSARVAYVDFEPVAVAHARQVIGELDTTTVSVTRADVREPRTVLAAPGVAGLLDFSRPVAVLMLAVLHFVDDASHDVDRIVAGYRDALVPGSAVVLSHTSDDQDDPEVVAQMQGMIALYRDSATGVTLRTRERIRRLFTGLDLVEPGLVDVADWPTPGTTPGPSTTYGAVGIVPGRSGP